MNEPLRLSVDQLCIRKQGQTGASLVGPLSFELGAGATALVGESGSGKSLTARALLNLLPAGLEADSRHLQFGSLDLRRLDAREWQQIRGRDIALLMQDPRHSLNPRLAVGTQLDEALRLHQRLTRRERQDRIAAALDEVGLSPARRWLDMYPHQLSGGIGQRVMLAMATINRPRLLIADEPTSALDAERRDQALELMMRLCETHDMALLLISHDLPLIARYCREALVMYRGRLLDQCPAASLAESGSAYTRALWSGRPGPQTYGRMLPVFEPSMLSEEDIWN